jgi:hypothetical protein
LSIVERLEHGTQDIEEKIEENIGGFEDIDEEIMKDQSKGSIIEQLEKEEVIIVLLFI